MEYGNNRNNDYRGGGNNDGRKPPYRGSDSFQQKGYQDRRAQGNRPYNNKGAGYGNTGSVENRNPFPPAGYLENGYYEDSEKQIRRKEYILSYARDIAQTLELDGGNNKNKRSQIRKFYDYCVRVRQKLDTKGSFSYVEADLANLDPMASQQKNRNVVSDSFYRFVNMNVKAVKDEQDFRAFVLHFQSIVAYMKKDEGGR